MRDGFGNGFDTQQFAEARDHLVAAVEQSNLHPLEVMHPIREDRARLVPIRTAGTEVVLHDPMPEALVGHRHLVIDAERLHQCQLLGPRGGHDAVHHGVGEAAVGIDPVSQLRVRQAGQRHHGLAQHLAVAQQVVAALAGKGADAPLAPQLECGHHRPESGAGTVGIFGIVLDVRVVFIETLGCRVDVVASLGHGQGDDADRPIGHLLDQGAVALFHRQVIDHRTHHLRRLARGIEFDQCGQAVLRPHLLAHLAVVGTHPRADDRPVMIQSLLEQPVQIPGLVRAMEVTQADMHDARGQRRTVVVRYRYARSDTAEIVVAQLCHAHGCRSKNE